MTVEDPVLEPGLVLVERQIPVFGSFFRQRVTGLGVVGIDEFVRREGSAAFLALVAISAEGVASRTFAADIAVGEEMSRLGIIELLRSLLRKLAGIVHPAEIIRSEAMMGVGGGTGIDIETHSEIGERAFDKGMIAVNHLLGGDAFFSCADSDGHAMLVGTAYEEYFLPLQP